MTVIEDLPPELLHDIIDALAEYRTWPPGVISVSSVNRKLRELSLPHLFAIIRVPNRAGATALTDLVTFLDSHPSISSYVKRLWIGHSAVLSRSAAHKIDYNVTHALLTRLPSLLEISFTNVLFVPPLATDISSAVPPPTLADLRGAHKLKLVILHKCSVDGNTLPLFQVLSLLEIDTLKVAFTKGVREAVPPDMLQALGPLRVRQVRISPTSLPTLPVSSTPLIDDLRRTLEPVYLRSVQLTCTDWGTFHAIGALFRDIGTHLTSVKLQISHIVLCEDTAARPAIDWAPLNLSACPVLQSIHFYLFLFSDGSSIADRFDILQFTACAMILRELRPTIRAITFELLELSEPTQLEQEHQGTPSLGVIEDAVMEERTKRFPELETVTLDVGCVRDVRPYYTVAAMVWPRLNAAGLLRVVSRQLSR
ncbi:hypothetical protein C8Q74DRAFT_241569 [Fomes fomentarius]|nr:hypothetical protein C8Q74DRAFT_241569 [Fomes fomentarius]